MSSIETGQSERMKDRKYNDPLLIQKVTRALMDSPIKLETNRVLGEILGQ